MTASDLPEKEQAAPGSKHLGWALVLICVAQLMVVLDSTIANIALPYIGTDLKIDASNLSWVVTGYALAFGGLLLLGGRLGDLYGRRRVFMIGVALFAVASALGGIAQNEAMLLGSRGLQGLGAALASPTALALITTTFPAGPARNRAFSVFAMMSGVGAAIGLILGGWLTDLDPNWGWRLTFLINVPIGLGAAFFAPRLLPDTDHHAGTLDLPGAVLGTGGLLALVYGITRTSNVDPDTISAVNPNGTSYGWGDPLALTAIALGVVALIAFVFAETRVKSPLMPLSIFASRTRAVAFVSMMITPAAMFAMFFFLSLYVQNIMGYSPLKAGFAFLPFCVGMVFGATLSSKLIAKMDPRFLSGTGTLIAGFALFMFSRLEFGSVNYWTDIAPYIVLMSLGMGLTFVPMTLVAVHGVRTQDAGIGSGVLNTMQQVGGALGLATLSAVAAHFTTSKLGELMTANPTSQLNGPMAFADGATHAFLVGAFMMWAASLIVWLLLNVKHTELAGDVPEGVHVG
ncbi:MFS transporter [Nocardioides nitrophenolicus]|uniref:MFS transporter n=1 Tax=Nocardioides nitrophenolicus TaxID=60489 RepID=UPI0019577518|nr:MFS transporter [Nocardioides nitrophenolicus]MBM7519406.1 EmrB/QacA subfamily drug resistance transporter [Nocardioides nitrophenolicus]